MNQNQDLHAWLSTKASALISWLAAFMGIGTFMGLVNAVIGVLSAGYLTLQIWNYFTYTRKKNRLEMQLLYRELEEANRLASVNQRSAK